MKPVNSFITVIVPAAIVAECRTLASAWAEGVGMFTTPLTSNGSTVSHYISSGMVLKENADLLNDAPAFTAVVNSLLGTSYSEAEISSVKATVDISSEGPYTAMARLGLEVYIES